MKTIKGDLIMMALGGDFDVIAHGCNCFCTMGSGIAAAIKRTWPEAYEADCNTVRGSKSKLGFFSYYKDDRLNLTILNMYTQFKWSEIGPDGTVDPNPEAVDYLAIRMCLKKLAATVSPVQRIGLPRIGCGKAGGKWDLVKTLMEEELSDLDVTIVEYDK